MRLAVWQKEAWQAAHDWMVQKRFPHALLVVSPSPAAGKLLVQKVTRQLLCQQKTGCGTCHACLCGGSGNHPDFFELGTEVGLDSIKILDVQHLLTQIFQTPQISDCQVVAFYQVDRLTHSAANALLKTLEEPPGHVYFILVTSFPHRLPLTIRSRCQQLKVTSLEPEEEVEEDEGYPEFLTHLHQSVMSQFTTRYRDEELSPLILWWMKACHQYYQQGILGDKEQKSQESLEVIWHFYKSLLEARKALQTVSLNKELLLSHLWIKWKTLFKNNLK